jgi:hypothetical protein
MNTLGPWTTVRAEAKASQPIISAMSWTSDLTSRESVSLDRRRLSLDSRHGCLETCTLGGNDMMSLGTYLNEDDG